MKVLGFFGFVVVLWLTGFVAGAAYQSNRAGKVDAPPEEAGTGQAADSNLTKMESDLKIIEDYVMTSKGRPESCIVGQKWSIGNRTYVCMKTDAWTVIPDCSDGKRLTLDGRIADCEEKP